MAKRRWITLGNRRRVQIDEQGRIVKGISKDARGVHVRDLPAFMGEHRDLHSANCLKAGEFTMDSGQREIIRDARGRSISPRFKNKTQAIEALLRDNPQLLDFVQENWGGDSQAYRHWLQGGQRGPKPQLAAGDGRFDPINELHNLRGPRRCSSYLEALYVTMPGTYRWEDIPERLWPLEECVGFTINPPEESAIRPMVREQVETCNAEKKERLEVLLDTARRSRLQPRNVPF